MTTTITATDTGLVVTGIVVSGDKRGRLLGFPTANIVIPPDAEIRDGVWAGIAVISGVRYAAAISVGARPTYYGQIGVRVVEVHVLDFDRELTGTEITAALVDHLRDQRWFGGSEELVREVQLDLERARRWARKNKTLIDAAAPSGKMTAERKRWLRDRRIAAAAALAHEEGQLTHGDVARLAGVPEDLVRFEYPDQSDLLVLALADSAPSARD